MNRTALRLATVAALTAGGTTPPTIAGLNVFDSRRDAISDLEPDDRAPVIVVRTDEDFTDRRDSTGKATTLARRTVALLIELSIVTARDDGTNDWPVSDAGLEAMLDLLEYQVHDALFGVTPWAMWWNEQATLHMPLLEIGSDVALIETDVGIVRFAARMLKLVHQVPEDCLPPARRTDDPVPAAALPAALVAIFDKVAADGAGKVKTDFAQIRTWLEARELPKGAAYPPLDGVTMNPPVTTTTLRGVPQPPTVRAELLEPEQ